MQLKCPKCLEPLNNEYCCSNNHLHTIEEGVLRLMTDDFENILSQWLRFFEDHRKDVIPSYTYDLLPNSGYSSNHDLWLSRSADLEIITKGMSASVKTVLDIGSWNGWLANQLSKQVLNVTAIDYFIHENDGLKARNQYKNPTWSSIQMDIESLDVLDTTFDLIVINRMISYVSNLETFIESCKKKLSEDGVLIITGINVSFRNAKELEQMRTEKVQFQKKYNTPLQFRPSKGFMNRSDLAFLQSAEFAVKLYPGIKNWLKKTVLKKKHASFFAIYSKNKK